MAELFGIFLILLGIGLFFWAQADFKGMVETLGRYSRWGGVLPSTRLGMSAAGICGLLIGVFPLLYGATMRYHQGPLTSDQFTLVAAMGLCFFGGLIHDLIHWMMTRYQR